MLKRLGRALTSPNSGVVLGVVLATVLYGDIDLTGFGVGLVVDPPDKPEAAILVALFAAFPALLDRFDPSLATLYTNPLYLTWLGLRIAAALAVCLPVAAWCRWYFRQRSDPDALMGTVLILLPAGLAWWLMMLVFQIWGEVHPDARGKGYEFVGPILALTPAFLLTLLASLFHQYGSERLTAGWTGGDHAIWEKTVATRGETHLPVVEVDLEPLIKAIEIDRTGLTLLGALVSSFSVLLSLVLLVVGAIVIGEVLATGALPSDGVLGDSGAISFIIIALPSVGFGLLTVLRWYRPRWFGLVMIALLLGALGFVVAEPFKLLAIEAISPAEQQLKQKLLDLAMWTLPITALIPALWLHAAIRHGRQLPLLRQSRREPLRLALADIIGVPRLILRLGLGNWAAQLGSTVGLMMQSLLRLYLIATVSTGILATFNSPLAWAKYQIAAASSACSGADNFDPLEPLTRIEVCPGNRDFDLAMYHLSEGPSFLNPMMLFIIAIPAFLGLWLGRAALGASARRYQAVASADPRPPILYLRPFHLDRVSLKWRPRLWSTVIVPRPAEPRSIDEIILNGCIEDGPVVAYGRPGEPAPPLGAARLYVGTGDWKAMVYALADASRYVVIAVEPTDGVVWEVEQTIANGWADKTLYLLTSARNDVEAWRMVRGITGHGPEGQPAPARQRPIAIVQTGGVWQVLFARDISRLAVEAAVQHFRAARLT